MTMWWQKGIIYQVYPRSFQDSNRDGVGDLPGITRRLDYLKWLGVDAVWISPIFASPMADFGYDVSDYRAIHPMFGALDDLDRLLDRAHELGLRVMLDFVPSHTSVEHEWFKESRRSRDNPKADWYLWKDAAPDGGPPNNWLSRFTGESAWEWDETRQQYYLHLFLADQPDLNWRNPEVREALFEVMRFWFDRGVDGFRVDVAYRIMKDPDFRDNPENPDWRPGMDPSARLNEKYTKNTPDAHLSNRWLRAVANEYEDKLLVGEINLPIEKLVAHYGGGDEMHLPLNVALHDTPWQAQAIRAAIERYEALLPDDAWPNWVLGNHDQHRIASRVGEGQVRVAQMLLLTLRGTPTMYYGDEIGMHDVEIPADRVQDPWELNVPGKGLGRDPERTPMQWSDAPNAGFCEPDVEPWLPVADDYEENNVETERGNDRSLLSLVKRLIEQRRDAPALHRGDIRTWETPDGLLAYTRSAEGERYGTVLNLTDQPQAWSLPEPWRGATLVLSTMMDRVSPVTDGRVRLRANEGVLLLL